MLFKIGVLKNFAIFTGQHLPKACNFIGKETPMQEYCEIFKNSFFYRTAPIAASFSLKLVIFFNFVADMLCEKD